MASAMDHARAVEDVTEKLNSHSSWLGTTYLSRTPLDDINELWQEHGAYESLSNVLAQLGSKILNAGLVDLTALAKALSSAASQFEANLFSSIATELYKSLAAKGNDAIVLNSVFTSIYFLGFLQAELPSSLPHYKDSYPPLGPALIRQTLSAAIGEEAFRENPTSNVDACKALAVDCGLLRPTDISYSIFPGENMYFGAWSCLWA